MTRLLVPLLLLIAGVSHAGTIMYVEAAAGGTPATLELCTSAVGGGGTAITVDGTSLGIVNGDLVFFVIGADSVGTPSTPVMTANGTDAWNTAHTSNADIPVAGTPMAGLFWHIAASDTVSAYRVDWTGAAASNAWVCRVTGQSSAPEQDQVTTATGDSDSIDAGATVGTDVLTLFIGLHDSGGDTFVCPAVGGVVDSCTEDDLASGVDIGIAEGNATGATGTVSFTSSTPADQWRTITWSINGT